MDLIAKTTAMYGNYRGTLDITVEEATEALVEVLESRGLPVPLTTEGQQQATSTDATVSPP
ncbi:hypothetical protein [Streptomyces griseorubiginosus]|uniref:hypothetical protein n=1 Tax=Streptomyces griseorubiginosus TaxID=67304 RepID=UPI0036F09CB3